jgi:signal transduction histidine kinase
MKSLYPFLLWFIIAYTPIAWGQDLSTLNYGLRSEMQTNTIYDLHFSKDNLLYIATAEGLWRYNGIQFQEILKLDGTSIEGSALREQASGQIFMQDFKGQLYQVVDDALHKHIPPKAIANEITAVHIGSRYIYYIKTDRIFVYNDQGQNTSVLRHANGQFGKSINPEGFLGMTIMKEGKERLSATCRLKDGQLEVFEEDWDFVFNPYFEGKRLLKEKELIYAEDQSISIDLSLAPLKITPRALYRIAGQLLVGCIEGLYFPDQQRLLLAAKDITDVVEDNEGNIWIATLNKGLHKLASLNNYYYPIENEEQAVHLIYKYKDNLIYADIGSNLYRYKGERFERFYESPSKVYPKNIYFDQEKEVYVYSGTFLQIFNADLEPLFYQTFYGAVQKDQEGQAFSKARIEGQLYYADLEKFYRFKSSSTKHNFQNQYYQKLILEDSMKAIWFDDRFTSEETYKWKDQLIYYVHDSLCFDDLHTASRNHSIAIPGQFQKVSVIRDRVYVQSSTHLLEYSLNAKLLNAISRKNGLEQKIDFLSSDSQYLAITTADAVHILESATLKPLYRFTTENGIKSIDFSKAWVYDGVLFVNGSEGLTEIVLEGHAYTKGVPSLELQDVVVNGQTVLEHQFNYQQNNLKISMKIRSFTAGGKLYWRLNGREWRVLEGEPKITLDDLQYGNYRLEAYWQNDLGGKSKVMEYSFVIHKPFWLQIWFILAMFGAAAAIVYGFYRRRMRQLKKRSDLEQGLIASQMTALKSQMNPHFIFNALNSIQSLILYRQNDEAYNYMDKFSILVRQILNFSDQDFIPLYQEIEMLKNYLDMEKMRFDGNLQIEMEDYEDLDVKIPSMIIQPFVENAIKHGLLHKTEGQKIIKISFELVDDETIVCEVTDNGIGRKEAQALQKENKRFGKSFSTGATQKRLELLQQLEFKRLGVEYTDLEDEEGNPLGTTVKITIPIE